ncbi:MAG: hypothetical protein RL456_3023 [Pseudomonadota bacterium]|jgi:DNA-binding MarR family transcriptional regulator
MNAPLPIPPETARADLLALDQQLCFALYAASLAMTRRYRPLLEPLGLTYPQYLVMLVLWERDGRGVGELGDLLSLDSGTLTPLLKRLETLGLVRRTRSREDERRVEITLTEAGRAMRAHAAAIPPQLVARTGCSLGELATLRGELHRLRVALGDTPAPMSPCPPTDPS